MELFEAIFTRRSIREYTLQAVPDELVHELLAAAMQAPSAGNQQPWHFIIVSERKQLDALADVLPFGKMLKTAPLAIAVCGDVEHARYRDYWVQDCSAATMNLLLAAHALGLGAVWLSCTEKTAETFQKKYGLPQYIKQALHIAVGWTAVGSVKSLRMPLSEMML